MSEEMTLQEAVGVTKQFGRFLKGLARLQEAADQLSAADQLTLERKADAARLSDENERAAADLAAATQAVDAARESAAAIVASAERDAKALKDAAQEAIRGQQENLGVQLAGLRAEVATTTAQLESAVTSLKSTRDEEQKVLTRIERAKADILRKLGG